MFFSENFSKKMRNLKDTVLSFAYNICAVANKCVFSFTWHKTNLGKLLIISNILK